MKRLLFAPALLLVALTATVRADAPKATVIPFQLLPSGHMAVMVKVNGKGPYRLIFDTWRPHHAARQQDRPSGGVAQGRTGAAI